MGEAVGFVRSVHKRGCGVVVRLKGDAKGRTAMPEGIINLTRPDQGEMQADGQG